MNVIICIALADLRLLQSVGLHG